MNLKEKPPVGLHHAPSTHFIERLYSVALRILVLGHTACGAIKGATKTYLASKTGKAPAVSKALDALLHGLSVVAESAEKELGAKATEEQIADLAVKKTLGLRIS